VKSLQNEAISPASLSVEVFTAGRLSVPPKGQDPLGTLTMPTAHSGSQRW